MIILEEISKSYPARGKSAEVSALQDISLTIDSGDIYGVIGHSGAGKSTLIRLINMLERPTRGTIRVDGVDLGSLDERALRAQRRSIGMIFQHFNLLSMRTVFDNVAFPLELAGIPRRQVREKVLPLLDLVGLADKRDRYPAELSGGQKQRVGIARALATEPKVLLCDEATSALDPETTQAILELIEDINRKLALTVVLITHEMHVIKRICHRVAVLESGQVIEEGPVFDIFTSPQNETTRTFVGSVTGSGLPEAIAHKLRPAPETGDLAVWRLLFTGPHADEPVLGNMARDHGITTNLLYGQLDSIQGQPFGTLVITLPADPETADRAASYLETHGVKREVLGYVAHDVRPYS